MDDIDEWAEKEAKRLIKEIDADNKREFEKTEKIIKTLQRIIKYAKKEKWQLYYLIEELETDIKIWKEKYL